MLFPQEYKWFLYYSQQKSITKFGSWSWLHNAYQWKENKKQNTPFNNCYRYRTCSKLALPLFLSLSLFTLCQKHTSFTDTLDKCGSLIIILFSPNTLPSSFITHRLTQPSDIYTLPRYTVSSLNFYFSSHSPMFYTLIKASGELHISHIWCWNTGSTIKTGFFPQQCNY